MSRSNFRIFALLVLSVSVLIAGVPGLHAQSGKGNVNNGRRIVTLNVIAQVKDGSDVRKDDFDLYDGGIPQEINSFIKLDRGTKIVLLVDNSSNVKADAG